MAIANTKIVAIGGGLSLIVGDFTATAGAAAQTYAVACGRVPFWHVSPLVTAEPVDFSGDLASLSITAGIATLTIYTQAGITAGSFVLLADVGGA